MYIYCCGLGPEWNGSEWVQELEIYVNPVDLRPMCLNILEILFEFFSLNFLLQIPYIYGFKVSVFIGVCMVCNKTTILKLEYIHLKKKIILLALNK